MKNIFGFKFDQHPSYALDPMVFFLLSQKAVDIHQGEVYKVLYIHVPNAFSAFLSSFSCFL